MVIVTRLISVVSYHNAHPSINSQDPSMRWSCKVTSKIKYIISPHVEDQWTPN